MNTKELSRLLTEEQAYDFEKDLIIICSRMPARKKRGCIKAMGRNVKKIEAKIFRRKANDQVSQNLTQEKRKYEIKIEFMLSSL